MEECNYDIYKKTKQRLFDFLNENGHLFGGYELKILRSIIEHYDFPMLYFVETVRNILEKLKLIPDEYNIYIKFLNLVEEIHGIEGKNIVEVGGGMFPGLAERIKLKQKNGKIVVFDPRLYKEYDSDKFTLCKKKIHRNSYIGSADLIIGLMPCEGAEALLDLAIEHDIDFVLWLCEGGPHGEGYDFYESEEEWLSNIIDKAKMGVSKKNMGELKKILIPDFDGKYPIIYNKRQKD